jgi:hypothetical protein
VVEDAAPFEGGTNPVLGPPQSYARIRLKWAGEFVMNPTSRPPLTSGYWKPGPLCHTGLSKISPLRQWFSHKSDGYRLI